MKLEFDSEKGRAFSLHKCKGVIFEKVTVNGCKVSDINLELVYPIAFLCFGERVLILPMKGSYTQLFIYGFIVERSR